MSWKMMTSGELMLITVITPSKKTIFEVIVKKWSRIPQTFPLYQSIPSFALFIWSKTCESSVHSKSIDMDC